MSSIHLEKCPLYTLLQNLGFEISEILQVLTMRICLGEQGKESENLGNYINMMLLVCFSSANIYVFGMMKGRSTLIVKTNTISTKAAYVNSAAAWWWMSCKWCQHLFLMMMRNTQSQWSNERADTLVHISPITVVYGGVMVAFSLFQSLLWVLLCLFTHSFVASQLALNYVYSDISDISYMGQYFCCCCC